MSAQVVNKYSLSINLSDIFLINWTILLSVKRLDIVKLLVLSDVHSVKKQRQGANRHIWAAGNEPRE